MAGDHHADLVFAGSVPDVYDRHMVPLFFEPYANDVTARLRCRELSSVLEIAAGTGVLTRAMAAGLPDSVALTATDLNRPMVDHAMAVGTARPVRWQAADAMALPFDDACFDAAVCQFGVMFFPDRAAAFAEVTRVVRPGGVFVFNVWDRIEHNDFAAVVTAALADLFSDDPPLFLARTPHGYHDEEIIRADLAAGGFDGSIRFEAVEARSRAASPEIPAIALCQGTPLRNEIEARDPARLAEATEVAASAIRRAFGPGQVDGRIRGFVVTAIRP